MKSNNLKYPKINNSSTNKLLFEEIARKGRSKFEEKSLKVQRPPNIA